MIVRHGPVAVELPGLLAEVGIERPFVISSARWRPLDVPYVGWWTVVPAEHVDVGGADGIVGTADDIPAGPELLTLPGPDGIVGTADDQQLSLANFSRTTVIAPVVSAGATTADLRNITITISYVAPQFKAIKKNYVLTSFISQYR